MKQEKVQVDLFVQVIDEGLLEELEVSKHCLQIKSRRINESLKQKIRMGRTVLEYSHVFPGENVIGEHAGKVFGDLVVHEKVASDECFFEFRTSFNQAVDVTNCFFTELMKEIDVKTVTLEKSCLRSSFFWSKLSNLFGLNKETRIIIEGKFEPFLIEDLEYCVKKLRTHFYDVEENFRRISLVRSSQEDMFPTRKFLRSKSFLFQNSFSNLRHLELFAARKEKKTNSREQCCFLLGLRDSLRGNKSVKLFLEVWSLYCSDPALVSCVYELGSSSCVKKVLFRNYYKEDEEDNSFRLLSYLSRNKRKAQKEKQLL
eukprot:snap_masked-scaffold_6-processed-gene-2.28-mRNA-1 protein AED:1.00 eAED:1.00 QI:0/-1/0/0/-1/1/1/0/314